MAQSKTPSYELPVVAISMTVWIKSCETLPQLNVARDFCIEILESQYGESAAMTIFTLLQLCDKQADFLKYRIPTPNEML